MSMFIYTNTKREARRVERAILALQQTHGTAPSIAALDGKYCISDHSMYAGVIMEAAIRALLYAKKTRIDHRFPDLVRAEMHRLAPAIF